MLQSQQRHCIIKLAKSHKSSGPLQPLFMPVDTIGKERECVLRVIDSEKSFKLRTALPSVIQGGGGGGVIQMYLCHPPPWPFLGQFEMAR